MFGPRTETFFGVMGPEGCALLPFRAGRFATDLNFRAGFAFTFALAMVPPIMWTDIVGSRRENGIHDSHGHKVRSAGSGRGGKARRHLPRQVVEPDPVQGQRFRRAPGRLRRGIPLAQARPRGRVLLRARGPAPPR